MTVCGMIRAGSGAQVALFHGLRPEHRAAAVRLYWVAFGAKLGRVLGPEPRAFRFLERVMDDSHVISAIDPEGRLAGVVGYRTHLGSFIGGGFRDLVAVYGAIGAVWRALCFMVLALDSEYRAMIVDGLAVRDDLHGRGVGRALLAELCDEALRRGFPSLRLDVVEGNDRARALYDRMGFEVIRQRKSWLTRMIFGFRRAHVMTRELQPSAPAPLAEPRGCP